MQDSENEAGDGAGKRVTNGGGAAARARRRTPTPEEQLATR